MSSNELKYGIFFPNLESAKDAINYFSANYLTNYYLGVVLNQVPILVCECIESMREIVQNTETFYEKLAYTVEIDEYYLFKVLQIDCLNSWYKLYNDIDIQNITDNISDLYDCSIFKDDHILLAEPNEYVKDAINLVFYLKTNRLTCLGMRNYPSKILYKKSNLKTPKPEKLFVHLWSN